MTDKSENEHEADALEGLEDLLDGEESNDADDTTQQADDDAKAGESDQTETTQTDVSDDDKASDDSTQDATAASQDKSWMETAKEEEQRKTKEYREYIEAKRARKQAQQEAEALGLGSDTQDNDAEHPSVFDDEKGYTDSVLSEVDRRIQNNKIESSQVMMREQHEDYDDKEKLFVMLAKDDPTLVNQMRAAPNPALFVYQHVTEHMETQEFRENKSEFEEFKKWKAEQNKEQDEAPTQNPSLANASAANTNDNTEEGEDSLDDLLLGNQV